VIRASLGHTDSHTDSDTHSPCQCHTWLAVAVLMSDMVMSCDCESVRQSHSHIRNRFDLESLKIKWKYPRLNWLISWLNEWPLVTRPRNLPSQSLFVNQRIINISWGQVVRNYVPIPCTPVPPKPCIRSVLSKPGPPYPWNHVPCTPSSKPCT